MPWGQKQRKESGPLPGLGNNLYSVLFHHFERFVAEYENRFERDYGYFRPIVKEVVEPCFGRRQPWLRIR